MFRWITITYFIIKEREREMGKSYYIRVLGMVLYLSVGWCVDDIIDGGRGGYDWHIRRLEILDPVMKLHLVQTRDDNGVDQLAWQQEQQAGTSRRRLYTEREKGLSVSKIAF